MTGDDTPRSGEPKTVLQVLPALGTSGGVERGTVEIAAAIAGTGWRPLVASAGGPRADEVREAGGCHMVLPLDRKAPWALRANAGLLADLIRRERVDLVHARSRAPAWSAHAAARRTGRPFVTTFHGTYGASWFGKRAYNRIMTRGNRVIAISEFIARHVREVYGVGDDRLRVVPRGVDVAAFDPALIGPDRWEPLTRSWNLNDGWPVVMMPGRLTRWKGQRVLIDAVAALGRRDIHCVLVGDDQGREDYRDELQKAIRKAGLNDVFRMVGVVQDMPAAYYLADVVVSASIEPEAFGRVAIEAQAMGRPIVATDHGGSTETVRPGETGWLVRPNDANALAAGINEALALASDARTKLGQTAIAHIRADYTTALMGSRVLAVYRELLP
ncbi:MAG: glycosyl transferase [Rhodospirillaceae bacterium]|nr:glycosyl transferase [Rhodospirillaceae bacterium]